MTSGLILFAHGARDPRWAQPFEAVAERVRALHPGVSVRLAFLELMSPDLPTAGAALAAEGCIAITIVPLFLGSGGHVRRDLPLIVDGLRASHPAVQWSLQPPVGEMPAVIEALAHASAAAAAAAAAATGGTPVP